jgi:predicted NAD/FAD-dependent oxidoreductase
MKIAIIGAGFTGCYLAHRVQEFGVEVTIFEKSRGVGGRLATRKEGNYFINHGTESFEAKGLAFQKFCDSLVEDGILEKLGDHYGTDKMNTLLKYLSQTANIKSLRYIDEIVYEESQYQLIDFNENIYKGYDVLFLTIPAEQILNLNININHHLLNELKNVQFDSMTTLVLYGESVKSLDKKILSTLPNLEKLYSPSDEVIVFHMDRSFSNSLNHLNKKVIKNYIVENIKMVIPTFNVNDYHHFSHLWKYGLTSKALGKPYIFDEEKKFMIVGDWLLGDSVEDAFESVNQLFSSFQFQDQFNDHKIEEGLVYLPKICKSQKYVYVLG